MSDEIRIYWTSSHMNAQLPVKAHPSDAGWDLFTSRDAVIPPHEVRDVHTDICMAMPDGWYGNIKPRSSTMVRWGLEIVEGVIDEGYRGEVYIQARNVEDREAVVPVGTRLAQVIFLPVPKVEWIETKGLPASLRGTKGFGQTGH